MPEEKTKKTTKKREPVYRIHNTTRDVRTRLTRARQPSRTRKNLLIGGGVLRIVRGRSQPVTESLLRRLLPELLRLRDAGAAKVTTEDGREVDLKTLKPLDPVPVPAPRPNKPLDSVDNDKTYEHGVGESLPNMPGGKAPTEPVKKPEVLSQDIPEGSEESEEEEDLEAVCAAIDAAWSRKELEKMAEEFEVTDLSGNKAALVQRFAEAGLRVADNGEEEDEG